MPSPRSAFVGRTIEVAKGSAYLTQTRLFTLLGAAGCGKSRLAIQIAKGSLDEFGDGDFYVDLSSIESGEYVLGAVADQLGAKEPDGGATLTDAVCRTVATLQALVVLDNCEHVIEESARVASTLLAAAPGVTILATSREPLAVDGELTWTVPPMTEADATTLFRVRALAIRPDHPLQSDDQQTMVDICQRLDGLPLAIELAAARTRGLSLSQIASGLDDRFDLLSNGLRNGPSRHASLRASIDWSYELLSAEDQDLWRHLGVFTDSFDLDGVTCVYPTATASQLGRLVDRSLVVVASGESEQRYALLHTLRACALDHLVESGQGAEARRRHRDHYLEVAERIGPLLHSGPTAWIPQVTQEQENFRAALSWSRDHQDGECLGRLAVAMTPYWIERSQWTECQAWLDSASDANGISALTRTRVLNNLCYIQSARGAWDTVPATANEALILARGVGDSLEEGRALGYLVVVMALAVGSEAAHPLFEEAIALGRKNEDGWGLSGLLTFFSIAKIFQGDPDETRQLLDEAVSTARAGGDHRWVRLAESLAAISRISNGLLVDSSLVEEVIADSRRAEHVAPLILGLAGDAWRRLLQGDLIGSLASAKEAVEVAQSQETTVMEGFATWILGATLSEQGELDEALLILTKSSGLLRGSEMPRWVGLPLVPLAHAYLDVDDRARAIECLDEATWIASAGRYPWILGRIQQAQARLSMLEGEVEQAEFHIHEALEFHNESGDVIAWCDSIDLLAALWTKRGHPDAALRLWGAASEQRVRLGCVEARVVTRVRLNSLDDAWRALGDAAPELWEEGRNLDLGQAGAYATRNRGKRGRPTSGWASLTPAELGVAQLVARHQTNPQIAEQLFISRSTVKTHLVHIFGKLNLTSRSQLAVEVARHDLD